MRVQKFRSLWGIDPGVNLENWKTKLGALKKDGYHGVEVDIYVLKTEEDFSILRTICKDLELQIVALIFSSWPQYIGPRPAGLTPNDHLGIYRQQLELASRLDPVKVNAQSGADHWSLDQSVEFYVGTLNIDRELGFIGKVCHETHRNRSLFNPQTADYVLQRVPELCITADISHWVLVSERLLNVGEEDIAILNGIIPHIRHIHTRIGTTQSSQCPEPLNPVFLAERRFFEWFWLKVIQHHMLANDTTACLSFVPEYGPFPYHPFGSLKSNEEVADEEGSRLLTLFEDAIRENQERNQ